MMNKILNFLKREKATTAMLVCVVAAIGAMWFGNTAKPESGSLETVDTPSPTLQMKALSERMMSKLEGHEGVWVRISMVFLIVVLTGLLLDVLFVIGYREGRYRIWGPLKSSHEVPWPVTDVFKAFVVLFFSEIVISLFLSIFAASRLDGKAPPVSLMMATTFIRNIVVALYVFYLVQKRYGLKLQNLGLSLKQFGRNMVMGLVTYLGFFPVYFTILILIMLAVRAIGYEPPVQMVAQIVYEEQNVRLVIFFSIFIAVIGPFFEEIFFRGFVYQAFRERWGVRSGVVLVSVVFAILHAHWVALVPIFALSVVLTLLFEKTQSLAACSVLHMAHNLIALVILLNVKGLA